MFSSDRIQFLRVTTGLNVCTFYYFNPITGFLIMLAKMTRDNIT